MEAEGEILSNPSQGSLAGRESVMHRVVVLCTAAFLSAGSTNFTTLPENTLVLKWSQLPWEWKILPNSGVAASIFAQP